MRGARCGPEGAGAIGRVGQRRRKRRARGGPNQWRAGGKHARGERTWNIKRMSVTLDVLRLSGWLKFHAACRVERRACEMRGEVRAGRREGVWGSGGGHKRRARDARRTRLDGLGRQGSGGERTPNMPAMVVTLDVLKLTGWLNLYAACRVERRACDHAGGEVRAGRCGS